jgi:hypothetical protein
MNNLLGYTNSSSYFPGETVSLFIHSPTKFGFADTVKLISPNQNVTLKTTNINGDYSIIGTLNQSTSTPGIYYKVSLDTQIVKIAWDIVINGNFILNPHITDLSGNQIYGIDNKLNLIDSSYNFIILKIPPNIKNLKVFLLARGKFKVGDTFIINNLYLFNVVKLTDLNMIIELYDIDKKLIKSYSETNIISQEYIKDSFAEGSKWKKSSELYLPSNLKSGYYFIKINYGSIFYIPIIIKSKFSELNTVLLLANTNTWNAYNSWSGTDGCFSAYGWNPTKTYIATSKFKTKYASTYVSNTLSFNRPDKRISDEILNYMRNNIMNTLYVSHLIYSELYLILFLKTFGINYHVITDMDLHTSTDNDISNYCLYNTMGLHVHPEYWSEKMVYNFNKIYSNEKTNLMYLGGNAIYWKIVIDDKNRIMEIRKDGSIHALDGTKGGLYSKLNKINYYLNKSNMLDIESILKISYEETYSRTLPQFNFPFVVKNKDSVLFRNFPNILNGDLICKLNHNSNILNSGASGWEVDKVHLEKNKNYIIAQSTCGTSDIIYVTDMPIKILSIGSITFTGSILFDVNSYLLLTNFLMEVKLIN